MSPPDIQRHNRGDETPQGPSSSMLAWSSGPTHSADLPDSSFYRTVSMDFLPGGAALLLLLLLLLSIGRCCCTDPDRKVCDGIGIGSLTNTIAVNSTNIGSFRNCTKINGDIILNKNSFEGDPHYNIGPMDPEHLWNLTTVKEITGYLVIMWWPENMTSLSVFENLEIIRGRTTFSKGYSFVVVQVSHLQWLGLRSLKEVSAGNVILKNMPELRYTNTIHWRRLFRSEHQVVIKNDISSENQTCNHECSEDGCWGPGPTMCVSCLHVDRGGRCVASCNLLQGEPREAQMNGRCVQCHQECLLQPDNLTCYGPGPANCSKCAHFQDGPQCILRCPHGMMGDGDTLIWKYADKKGQCQPCHQNCTQGCSGPGLSGCKG